VRQIVYCTAHLFCEENSPPGTPKPLGEETESAEVISHLTWIKLEAFTATLEDSICDVGDLADSSLDAINLVRQEHRCFGHYGFD
jgi:hypothetical protein